MTNSDYVVHYRCHVCGRMHPFCPQLLLPDGPTKRLSLIGTRVLSLKTLMPS
jgi:hypothetical protein